MIRREKEVIRAIYHKDTANFFESVGLSKKLKEGKLKCIICGETIRIDNFRAVMRKSGKLLFCCNKESCIQRFGSFLKEESI